jgi:glycine oxidase
MSESGLRENNRPRVAIVGGGIMGCVVGLRLAQRGFAVTIIERGIPGAEASSAAAGILGPQWETECPGALLDFGLASRALYADFAAELRDQAGIDIGYRQSGLIELACDEAGETALAARESWQRTRGLRAEVVRAADLARLEPGLGPAVRAGLFFPDEGMVNARALARALSQAAAIAGVTFLQGRYVRRVAIESGRAVGVELDGERIAADVVVIAAGSWSGLVDGAGVGATLVRPARGQMVAIEMRPPLFHHVLAPWRRGYLVPRHDGVALAGSTLEMVGFRKEVTVDGLALILDMARAILPALGPLPVVETWSNFRPFTEDQLPVLGATEVQGLHLATGHHRYGILLAPITGLVVAEQIATGRPRFDLTPFSASRFTKA